MPALLILQFKNVARPAADVVTVLLVQVSVPLGEPAAMARVIDLVALTALPN